jgi:RecB family endonuclease NucS
MNHISADKKEEVLALLSKGKNRKEVSAQTGLSQYQIDIIRGGGSRMTPTPEGTARAKKAWETIRKKKAQKQAEAGAVMAKASKAASEIFETKEAHEAQVSLERDLQAALRANIEQLENGLSINDGGKEKTGSSGGRTDILAIDANGQDVIIELKVGKADRDVIGQTLQYMGDLQEATGKPARGLVIAHDFTARAIAASKPVSNIIELRKYGFNFSFKRV